VALVPAYTDPSLKRDGPPTTRNNGPAPRPAALGDTPTVTAADDPLHDPSSHVNRLARAIGYLIMEAGRLELAMGWLYGRLLHSPVGELAAAGQSFDVLRNGCLAIAKDEDVIPPDRRAEIEEALGRAYEAQKRRNKLVHGHYVAGLAGTVYTVGSRRGTSERQIDPWTIEEIKALAADIRVASDAVADIARKFEGPGHPRGDHLAPRPGLAATAD
jgi:hypothetical protein